MTKQQMELDLMVNKQGMALVLLKSAPNPMEETTHEFILKNLQEVSAFLDAQLQKALARGHGLGVD